MEDKAYFRLFQSSENSAHPCIGDLCGLVPRNMARDSDTVFFAYISPDDCHQAYTKPPLRKRNIFTFACVQHVDSLLQNTHRLEILLQA